MTKQQIIQQLQDLLSSCNHTYNSFQENEIDEQEFHDQHQCNVDWFMAISEEIVDYLKTHRCYKKKEELL